MASVPFFIPPSGHSLGSGLRQLLDAGGNAFRVELVPASPFSGDPEFDSSSLSAWTQSNSANATTIDSNTTLQSHLFMDVNANNSKWNVGTTSGPAVYQVVSGDFDIYTVVKVGGFSSFNLAGLLAQSTSLATDYILNGAETRASKSLTFDSETTDNGVSTDTEVTFPSKAFSVASMVYLRLKRAANTFTTYYSFNGKTWTQLRSDVRNDFSANANLGVFISPLNAANTLAAAFDFIRTWPPYSTSTPVSSVVLDSGAAGTVWTMSTFTALTNPYAEFNPQAQIGYGSLAYQYGAGESNPPSLNGSDLTQAQMQAQSNPTGRYFKLQVKYTSANGYEQASFLGGNITGTMSTGGLIIHPGMTGGLRG